MKHSSVFNKYRFAQLSHRPVTTMAVAATPGNFLIEPWLGIIGLCVLVITGAIAVIREIRIEEEENQS